MIVALACTVLIQGQAFDLFVAQYGWYSTIISIKCMYPPLPSKRSHPWIEADSIGAKYWGLVGRLGKVPAMVSDALFLRLQTANPLPKGSRVRGAAECLEKEGSAEQNRLSSCIEPMS